MCDQSFFRCSFRLARKSRINPDCIGTLLISILHWTDYELWLIADPPISLIDSFIGWFKLPLVNFLRAWLHGEFPPGLKFRSAHRAEILLRLHAQFQPGRKTQISVSKFTEVRKHNRYTCSRSFFSPGWEKDSDYMDFSARLAGLKILARFEGPITWWVWSRAEISTRLTGLKFQIGFWNKSSENQVVDYMEKDSARAEKGARACESIVFSHLSKLSHGN